LTKFSFSRTAGLLDNFFPINVINTIAREHRQLYLIASKTTKIDLHPNFNKQRIDSPSENGKTSHPHPERMETDLSY
jgi:hypothetical protein